MRKPIKANNLEAVAPPGMEDAIKEMKRKGVKNPWAIAWSIYNKKHKKAASNLKFREVADSIYVSNQISVVSRYTKAKVQLVFRIDGRDGNGFRVDRGGMAGWEAIDDGVPAANLQDATELAQAYADAAAEQQTVTPQTSRRSASPGMSKEEFVKLFRSLLDLQGRQIHINDKPFAGNHNLVTISYINLPGGTGSAGGGAEAMNNRILFSINGFARTDANQPVETVRLEVLSSALPRSIKLRAKKASPEKIAHYLADFLNNVAKTVEPRYTHTQPPTTAGVRRVAGTSLFVIDDDPEPFTLEDFIASNEDAPLDESELAAIRALAVGDAVELGGGAFASFTIRRVASGRR